MEKRAPLWGLLYLDIYLYILIGGRRSYERYVLPYTLPLRIHAYMDTNAYGDMYIYMRRYGGMPNAVHKYTHGGKYHIQKYHRGDYPHGST